MVASLMSLNAFAIDIMLPALGDIARELAVVEPNDRQLVVGVYILGLGLPQLFFGPLADGYGRRPTLFVSLVGYVLTAAACALADRFVLLLAARFAQGAFAAGTRVVAVAVVRDAVSGAAMARIMSLVMTVFMIVPIAAPGLGQLILFVAPWRWCFGALAVFGMALLLWAWRRLPESMPPAAQTPSFSQRMGTYREVLRHHRSLGYMVASGFMFGALFAFISASEQIFRDVFHQGDTFALWFAGVALAMSIGNLINARLVMDFGSRRLSHFAVLGFTSVVLVALVLTMTLGDALFVFYPCLVLMFVCFGFVGTNFNALAMEPLGRIAGAGAAAYGFVSTTVSAFLGGLIGRMFDGTTAPIWAGYFALGLAGLAAVLAVERRNFLRE